MNFKTTQHFVNIFMVVVLYFVIIIPGQAVAGEPKPGDIIDASNAEQYKDYYPSFIMRAIKDGWGIEKPAVFHVKEPIENLSPPSFRDVTMKNAGKTKLNADGSLTNYFSGLPFPNPKEPDKALKIMWNYTYRWRADDFNYPGGYMTTLKRQGGRHNYSRSEIRQLNYCNRTTISPRPKLENRAGLQFAQMYLSMTPPSKDMATLTWRYEDPFKDDDMWTYVPTLRRTLRLVSSERTNPVRGTAYTWDDFYGFDGQVMKFDFSLLEEKKLLAIMNQNTRAFKDTKYENGYDRSVMCGPEDPYEITDAYVINAAHKNKCSETKKVLYISKDISCVIYSEVYDKKGDLWKGLTCNYAKLTTEQGETGPWATGSGITDYKTNFWTYALLGDVRLNVNQDPKLFSPGVLGTF